MKNKLTPSQAKLVEAAMQATAYYARQYAARYYMSFDELQSIGYLALCSAALKFDKSKSVKFETFASQFIRRAIIAEIRKCKPATNAGKIELQENGCSIVDKLANKELLDYAINKLPVNWAIVISLRFESNKTYQQIAEIMNLTRQRVHQIEKQALERLKTLTQKRELKC